MICVSSIPARCNNEKQSVTEEIFVEQI